MKKYARKHSADPVPDRPKTPSVKLVSSKVVYRAPVFYVTTNRAIESGKPVRRDIVRHPGSIVIMPVDDSRSEPRVLLVRQYRFAADQFIWELPAGHMEPGEDPLVGAKRELLEETGYTAKQWKRILHFYVSPGFLDEKMNVYLATGLTPGKAQPEDDESITKRFFPLHRALSMVNSGKILDAKTTSSILWLGLSTRGKRRSKL